MGSRADKVSPLRWRLTLTLPKPAGGPEAIAGLACASRPHEPQRRITSRTLAALRVVGDSARQCGCSPGKPLHAAASTATQRLDGSASTICGHGVAPRHDPLPSQSLVARRANHRIEAKTAAVRGCQGVPRRNATTDRSSVVVPGGRRLSGRAQTTLKKMTTWPISKHSPVRAQGYTQQQRPPAP